MDNLIEIKIDILDDKFVVDSKQVAQNFQKRHDNVLRDIENIKKDVLNFEEMFIESETSDSYGRRQRIYLMNRDGFSLLAMGFTGKEALDWKLKYIEAFNKMEKAWNTPEQIFARALKMADKTIESLKKDNAVLIEDNERMKPKEIFGFDLWVQEENKQELSIPESLEKTASPAKIKTIKNMCTSHGIDGDAWVTSNGKTWETLTEGEAAKMLTALKGKFGDD